MTIDRPLITCNKMVYQDDSRALCYLILGHDGDCKEKPSPRKLTIKPHMTAKTIYEEDPRYKEVSRGDASVWTVPTWIADILERHADEIDGLP